MQRKIFWVRIIKKESAYYLWHFSHFIEKGAVRVATSKYNKNIETVAFKKDDKITVIMFNQTKEDIPVYIRLNNQCVEYNLKAESIATGVIE